MNSNASISLSTPARYSGINGTDFEVDGGTVTVSFAGDDVNTAGRSILIENIAGGSVMLGEHARRQRHGMLVQNNTAGTISFNGAIGFRHDDEHGGNVDGQ